MGRVFLSAVRLQRTNIATKNIPDHQLFGNRLIWLFRGLIGLPTHPFQLANIVMTWNTHHIQRTADRDPSVFSNDVLVRALSLPVISSLLAPGLREGPLGRPAPQRIGRSGGPDLGLFRPSPLPPRLPSRAPRQGLADASDQGADRAIDKVQILVRIAQLFAQV